MEEYDEVVAQSSLSPPNPVASSSQMKQGRPPSTRKMLLKKPSNLKSKAKQVSSDNPKKSESYKRKRTGIDDVYNDLEAKICVMERANQVLRSLEDEFPSFLKCMLPSNVAYSFWMIFPVSFAKLHLPRHDATITLVDETGEEYRTNFLIHRHGLSGGWRGFAIKHRLLKGDVLVFHMIEPFKLKVYIERVYGLDVLDAALCLMNLDAFGKRTESGNREKDHKKKDDGKRKKTKKHMKTLPLDIHQPEETPQTDAQRVSNSGLLLIEDQSESNSEGFNSEVLEDYEITNHLQSKELSYSENLFSHDHFLTGISCR